MDAVRLPGGRRRARGVHPRGDHARLPRRPRRARAARRDRHHDPGAPVQPGHGRGGRVQGRHAAARGERLPVARRAQGGGVGAHRLADDEQPRRHGHLQPRDREVGRGRARRGRALLLRPRQLQRRDGEDQGRATSASTPACTCCTRPSARRRRGGGPAVGAYGCTRGAGAASCPSPGRRRATATATGSTTTGPTRVGKVREFWGNVPQLVYAYTWSRAMGAEGIERGGRHLGAREQLHGEAAPRDPRRHQVAAAPDGAPHRDDALQPRARSSATRASR